jgi:hypothetical protein
MVRSFSTGCKPYDEPLVPWYEGQTVENDLSLMTISIGSVCEIREAYNMDTGRNDLMDEYSHCVCEVEEFSSSGEDALVWIKGTGVEVWIPFVRLKNLR